MQENNSKLPAPVVNPAPNLWRSLQTLNWSRVLIALILFLYLHWFEAKSSGFLSLDSLQALAIFYGLNALLLVLLTHRWHKRFLMQLSVQICLDLCVISVLFLSLNVNKSSLLILYLYPLAGVAILGPLVFALFFASAVSIFLLLESAYRTYFNVENIPISQVGLYCIAFFSVVWVFNRLAQNLVRQEELASRRGQELAMQQAINRNVIVGMEDGIMVVDAFGAIFELNPAAQAMLNLAEHPLSAQHKLFLRSKLHLHPIAQALEVWQSIENQTLTNQDEFYVNLPMAEEGLIEIKTLTMGQKQDFTRHLRLRFVHLQRTADPSLPSDLNAYTLIFLQNVSDIENQAQQLKLASMGRLTASIAHEVRNPLASISYAASLINEDDHHSVQSKRLLKIIDDNVKRLNQLIEDILKLSRKVTHEGEAYDLAPVLTEFVNEFIEIRQLDAALISLRITHDFKVVFDTQHLHEIVHNLLSNALRYASGKPNCIRINLKIASGQRHELHIQDDGPGISALVRAHLFEPFYTTSSQGTGLGLYMARELCLNNRANIDYEFRNDDTTVFGHQHSGRFVIHFAKISQL
jgi:two-component system sensor histidine kinase PilS (NtrC family)